MASLDSLHALLEEELKDIYDAEKQITKALPKMAKKASSPDLIEGLEAHLRQTEEQIDRLEQVFEQLEMPAKGKPCKGMKNLIAEGDNVLTAFVRPEKDANGQTYYSTWFDLYRIKDGKVAEHWDPMLKSDKPVDPNEKKL